MSIIAPDLAHVVLFCFSDRYDVVGFQNDGFSWSRTRVPLFVVRRPASRIRHPNQSIQYTLLSNLRPPEYFGCARNAAAINRSTVIEIFYVARRLYLQSTVAAMIIRGFRWSRFELVEVGILVDYTHTCPPVPCCRLSVTRGDF